MGHVARLGAILSLVALRSAAQDPPAATTTRIPAAGLQADERIARSEAAMARKFDPAFRQRLRERFAGEASVGLPQVVGDTRADLLYTPVVPCRVFDTRLTAQGPLTPGVPRDFLVAGTADFLDQGGTDGGCGVPLGPATSVVVNLATVDPSGTGNLRAWAFSDPPAPVPFASVLNFTDGPPIANAVVLPICDAATVACTSDLRLQAVARGADVVGDVLGYFRALDLRSEVLVGATSLGPFPITGDDLVVAADPVVTPPRFTDCVVTCSISIASTAANAAGSALLQSGARFTGGSGYSGTPMPVPLVPGPGTSSVAQSTWMGFTGNLSVRPGCHVAATSDFIGDTAQGTVAWVCR
jgi:hypothetical protein